MSNGTISKEQLFNINKVFSNNDIKKLLENNERLESLSLENLKKICNDLVIKLKNRDLYLFPSYCSRYFKDYQQVQEIIKKLKKLNVQNMTSIQLIETLIDFSQLCNYKLAFDKLEEKYTIYTTTLQSAKDILKYIDFANQNPDLFNQSTLDILNELKENIEYFIDNIKISDDSFEYENIDILSMYIDKYNTLASEIWKSYITDNISQNTSFHYLVHDGIIRGKKYYRGTLSTSLITNEHLETYREGYGIIVNPIIIESAVSRDSSTDNSATIENTKTKNGIRTICLPEQVARESKENKTYSEIALQEYEIIGVFAIDNQYNSIIKNIRAKLLAKQLQVPLVKIDSKTKTQKLKGNKKQMAKVQDSGTYSKQENLKIVENNIQKELKTINLVLKKELNEQYQPKTDNCFGQEYYIPMEEEKIEQEHRMKK